VHVLHRRRPTGACDRYANVGGDARARRSADVIIEGAASRGRRGRAFLEARGDWDGDGCIARPTRLRHRDRRGTTYPDYKPAPFIVSPEVEGVDMVTVVTEGIFSYCGVKVKIDTDRHLGPSRRRARRGRGGRPCHDQRIRLADAVAGRRASSDRRLKKEGRVTCDALLALCNREAGRTDHRRRRDRDRAGGQAAGRRRRAGTRMRVGCGSATIGMFAKQWRGLVDEVVVVDDHITGVLSEHQAGKLLGMEDTGIRMKGRRSTPGRYFQVAEPGTGWGGTNITDPLEILGLRPKKGAWPGPVAADGVDHRRAFAYYVLDDASEARREADARPRCRRRSSASRRTASRRCARCCSWAAPAARCAPASPKTRCA
jgi:hypothetical protein